MDLVSLLTSTTSKGNPNAWDISKAYYDAGSGAWDISQTSFDGFNGFSVATEESGPTGLFFKPDGTKMYVCGTTGDDVNEYTLSTPWLVRSASYAQNFSVSAQETSPEGLFFKPDGTKMYVVGSAGDDVNEYDLSSAWDISTASYVQNFSVATEETTPTGIFFKDDGTKMYISGGAGDDVNEYSLSSAWDISTASYVQNFSVASQETAPEGLFFKPDGLTMYVVGQNFDNLNEYSLSSAWDISTASYVQLYDIPSPVDAPHSVFFKPDGSSFYLVQRGTSDAVYQYIIGGFSVAAQETTPEGLFFKPDGTKMYVTGSSGDDVNEYDLSTAWDISTASYLQNFSVASQETSPRDLFFKPDGTKMYVAGAVGDDINEYDLSSAWDISSASYLQNFSVASQETTPNGLFFKPDGLKMYVVGTSSDAVNEYTLSSAWDVSSASYVQNFSVSSQDTVPTGLFFKPDGTKMYVTGNDAANVYEYSLSNPWDVSSASYTQAFSTQPFATSPEGLFFKPDGTQFWVIENKDAVDSIFSCLISPE